MASYISSCLFKHYFGSNYFFKLVNHSYQYSANKLCNKPKFYSTMLSENIQVPKHLQPLIEQPIEEIFSSINDENTSGDKSVLFLKAFRMQAQFKGIDIKKVSSDSRFNSLCDIFEKNCSEMSPNKLISGLRSLLELGVSPNDPCVVSAEKRILENIHKIDTFDLIVCLKFHQKFALTNLQKEVISTLLSNICEGINNVNTGSEILMLCSVFNLFSDSQKKIIEQKIVNLLPQLNVQDLCKVLRSLSAKSIRNIMILNAISFQFQQKKEVPGVKATIDIFYSFKALNFCDPTLFSHLLKNLAVEIHSVEQPSIISGLLSTCGHLRWRSTDLLNACSTWIENNLTLCRTREFVSYILTTAALCYSTPQTREIIDKILNKISLDTVNSRSVLLDIAWSLAILGHIPKELLISVLSPSFYKPLIGEDAAASNILKLLNLKGLLKLKYPEYVFSTDLYLEPSQLQENIEITNCRKHVLNVLSNFVPKDTCLHENQINDMGIFIDAEFIMDKNFKPLSIVKYGTSNNIRKQKVLPDGANRFCLLIMFHKDYTLNTPVLTGVNLLSVRLLSKSGLKVVEIPYDEFSQNKTELEKAKYLQQKIKHSIAV